MAAQALSCLSMDYRFLAIWLILQVAHLPSSAVGFICIDDICPIRLVQRVREEECCSSPDVLRTPATYQPLQAPSKVTLCTR